MGFEIMVSAGAGEDLWIRGCEDGTVELCKFGKLEPLKATPDVEREGLIAFKYYASPEQAFNRVMQMRIGRSNASTLKELVDTIKAIRADIKKELGTAINPE